MATWNTMMDELRREEQTKEQDALDETIKYLDEKIKYMEFIRDHLEKCKQFEQK